MASAKYTTSGESTLASGINTSATSIDVATGHGSKFPSSGDFWLRLTQAADPTAWEIVKATARSGDSITITRNQTGSGASSPYSFSTGDAVVEVVTAAALDQMRIDGCQTGAAASAASEKQGNLYLPTDGISLMRDSGSAMVQWGPVFPFTDPNLQSWSWVNQGGATVSSSTGGITIYAPAHSGDSFRIRKKSAPSTPYTITAAFMVCGVENCMGGIGWRQSSDGKLMVAQHQIYSLTAYISLQKLTNETTYSANYASWTAVTQYTGGPVKWFKISDDGTNRKIYYGVDGQNWIPLHSIGRTDFLTGDEVIFFCSASNGASSGDAYITLLSWKEA